MEIDRDERFLLVIVTGAIHDGLGLCRLFGKLGRRWDVR
jgi:hypothetical protein